MQVFKKENKAINKNVLKKENKAIYKNIEENYA